MRGIIPLACALAAFGGAGAQAASFGTNLVTNGGGELGNAGAGFGPAAGFTTTGGFEVRSYTYGGGYPVAGDPGVAQGGDYFFDGGSVLVSTGEQLIDVATLASSIDGGAASYTLSALLGGYASQDDNALLSITFEGVSGALGVATIGPVTSADRGSNTALLLRSASGAVPVGTRAIDLVLTMSRLQGERQ